MKKPNITLHADRCSTSAEHLPVSVGIDPSQQSHRKEAKMENKELPADVANAVSDIAAQIREKEIIIFCGAGVSRSSGMPTVNQMAPAILEKLGIKKKDASLVLDDKGNLKDLPFEAFMELLHENSNSEELFGIFDVNRNGEELIQPNANHFFMAEMVKDYGLETIVTTNFDRLIENALKAGPGSMEAGRHYDLIFHENDFGNSKRNGCGTRLVKIHGSVDDIRDMAITIARISQKQISLKRRDLIEQVFSTGNHKAVLILGYSCSDSFDLVPFMENIDNGGKYIWFCEHSKIPSDKAWIQDVSIREKKNPFKKKYPGKRIYINTDDLVRELRIRLPFLKKREEAGKTDIMNQPDDKVPYYLGNIDRWIGEFEENGEARKSLITGQLLILVSRFPEAVTYLKKAMDESGFEGQEKLRQTALQVLGNAYHMTGDFQTAMEYYEQSLEIAHKLRDLYATAICYDGLGVCCNALSDSRRALYYFGIARNAFRDLNIKKNEGISCLNIGIAYDCLGNRKEAIRFLEMSIVLAREIGSLSAEVDSLANLGNVYNAEGNPEKAVNSFKSALEIYSKLGNRTRQGMIYGSIGISYDMLENYDNAIRSHEKSLEIARETGNKMAEGNSCVNMGISLVKSGQHQKALEYYGKALEILQPILSDSHPFVRQVESSYLKLRSYLLSKKCLRKTGMEMPDTGNPADCIQKKPVEKSVEYSTENFGFSFEYLATTYAPWIPGILDWGRGCLTYLYNYFSSK